ncbi:hypothetical protein NQZ79_g1523 [Umbelopsis isabellina]|nr:hypothetical protein NQZ79_g1523 [Umbelopsis isabellina]
MTTVKRSEDQGFLLYQTTCALIAAIAGLNVGWHISVPNMPQKIITNCGMESSGGLPPCLPMTDYVWGLTVGLYAIGGLVGSLGTMFTNMWFGRRANIMICTVFTIVGGIFSALAVNTGMYIVGRVFVGIGSGLAGSSVPIYVSEISTKRTRGALGSFFELFLNLGILFTQVAGLYLSKVPDWRFLWVIPSVLALVQLILLIFFTVECPRRLCANKKYDQAKAALQKLRGDADIEQEFNNLLEARKRDEHRRQMTLWEVISGKDKHVLINTIYVMVLLAYNQIGGVGPMSVYSVSFFTTIFNGDTNMATNLSIIDAAVNIVATLIAVFFMNKVGRKGFMLISTGGMTIACIGIVIGSSVATEKLGPLVIFSAILFLFTYSLGCGVVPWLMIAELLPLHALAAGSALGNSSNWLVNFVENTLWPIIDSSLQNYSFIIFIIINFIGFLFCIFCLEETTHKDLDRDHSKPHDKPVDLELEDTSNSAIDKTDNVEHVENMDSPAESTSSAR